MLEREEKAGSGSAEKRKKRGCLWIASQGNIIPFPTINGSEPRLPEKRAERGHRRRGRLQGFGEFFHRDVKP